MDYDNFQLSNVCIGSIRGVFFVKKEIIFGINQHAEWVKIIDGQIFHLDYQHYDTSLLTLLEFDFHQLRERIINVLKEKNINARIVDNFPFEIVILNGLKSESDYWINLSLLWLNNDNLIKNMDKNIFMKQLSFISKDKGYSQKIRHNSLNIIKNFQAPR